MATGAHGGHAPPHLFARRPPDATPPAAARWLHHRLVELATTPIAVGDEATGAGGQVGFGNTAGTSSSSFWARTTSQAYAGPLAAGHTVQPPRARRGSIISAVASTFTRGPRNVAAHPEDKHILSPRPLPPRAPRLSAGSPGVSLCPHKTLALRRASLTTGAGRSRVLTAEDSYPMSPWIDGGFRCY